MTPLRAPAFRRLWLAGLISDTGDWLLLVSLPIFVYGMTRSTLSTAFAFLAGLAPPVLLSPLAGFLADRFDRRRLLMWIAAAQAGGLIPLLTVHSVGDLPILYGVIALQSALLALFEPAKSALLPTLVGPGQLVAANSLVGLNANLGRLAGGPIGGLVLAVSGLPAIVAIDAASFVIAAALIWQLPPARATDTAPSATPASATNTARSAAAATAGADTAPSAATTAKADSAPSAMTAAGAIDTAPNAAGIAADGTAETAAAGAAVTGGWLGDRRVRGALAVAALAGVAQGIFAVLFVVFVAEELHGGDAQIGLLRGIQAVGAIGAGLVLATARRSPRPGPLLSWALLAFGLLAALIWNTPPVTTALPVYIALFVLVGAPGVAMMTGLMSLLQMAVPDRQRGRVIATFIAVFEGCSGVGMLAAGVLGDRVGTVAFLDVQAALYVTAGVLAAFVLARSRPHTGAVGRATAMR